MNINAKSDKELGECYMNMALEDSKIAHIKGEVPIGALLVERKIDNSYRVMRDIKGL